MKFIKVDKRTTCPYRTWGIRQGDETEVPELCAKMQCTRKCVGPDSKDCPLEGMPYDEQPEVFGPRKSKCIILGKHWSEMPIRMMQYCKSLNLDPVEYYATVMGESVESVQKREEETK